MTGTRNMPAHTGHAAVPTAEHVPSTLDHPAWCDRWLCAGSAAHMREIGRVDAAGYARSGAGSGSGGRVEISVRQSAGATRVVLFALDCDCGGVDPEHYHGDGDCVSLSPSQATRLVLALRHAVALSLPAVVALDVDGHVAGATGLIE